MKKKKKMPVKITYRRIEPDRPLKTLVQAKEARVWTVKDGYRLGDDIQSKVLAFAFGLSAEIERNLISQRTKEALDRKRAEGVRLGRKPGSRNKEVKLTKDDHAIRSLLAHGCNYSQIARLLEVDRTTLMGYYSNDVRWDRSFLWMFGQDRVACYLGTAEYDIYFTQIGNTLEWWATNNGLRQLNNSDITYKYLAIG